VLGEWVREVWDQLSFTTLLFFPAPSPPSQVQTLSVLGWYRMAQCVEMEW